MAKKSFCPQLKPEDTKLSGVVDTHEKLDGIRRDMGSGIVPIEIS